MSHALKGLTILRSERNKKSLTTTMYTALVKEAKRSGQQLTVEVMMPVATASALLTDYNLKNRTISKVNVASLVRDMKNGKWVGHVGDEVTVDSEGQLNNGQHRLRAIVEAGIAQPVKMCFGMTKQARAAEGSGRSKSGADLISFKYGAGAKNKEARAAALRLLYGFLHDQTRPKVFSGNHKPTHSEFADVEEAFGDSIYESLKFVNQQDIQTITVESNAAFLHFILKHSKFGVKAANEFFEKLGRGANLSSDDPVMIVRQRFIKDAQNQKTLRHQSNKDSALGLIIKAWNASMDGKSWSNRERTPDALLPVKGLSKIGGYKLYVKPKDDTLVDDLFS